MCGGGGAGIAGPLVFLFICILMWMYVWGEGVIDIPKSIENTAEDMNKNHKGYADLHVHVWVCTTNFQKRLGLRLQVHTTMTH